MAPKFSKRIENTVGKGEIAPYEQFLLFPQCFQKACFAGASKGVIVWEWVKAFADDTCTDRCPPFSPNSKLLSANSLSLGETEIYCLEKGEGFCSCLVM